MDFKQNIQRYMLYVAVFHSVLLSETITASQRGLINGEKMPEFSALSIQDSNYIYQHGMGKAMLVMFISTGQANSSRAVVDISQILSDFPEEGLEQLNTTIVVEDANDVFAGSQEYRLLRDYNIVLDSEYKLWGKFGVTATPTLIISDVNDTIAWIKAGYSYDYISLVRTHLNQILELEKASNEEEIQVQTATNDSISARVERILQMAEILYERGRLESAIAEVSEALKLDPNSIEAKLDLAELFCRTNQNEAVLNIVDKITDTSNLEKAKCLTLSGWANRQMGELDIAEGQLNEAVSLDPKSVRALFELGRIYQDREQFEKAMNTYYKALTIIMEENISQ